MPRSLDEMLADFAAMKSSDFDKEAEGVEGVHKLHGLTDELMALPQYGCGSTSHSRPQLSRRSRPVQTFSRQRSRSGSQTRCVRQKICFERATALSLPLLLKKGGEGRERTCFSSVSPLSGSLPARSSRGERAKPRMRFACRTQLVTDPRSDHGAFALAGCNKMPPSPSRGICDLSFQMANSKLAVTCTKSPFTWATSPSTGMACSLHSACLPGSGLPAGARHSPEFAVRR